MANSGILIRVCGGGYDLMGRGLLRVRKNLGKPIGSLTQMGTIRLGKRTEKRVPKIKDFVPLSELGDIEFGGWDIFEDNAYEAAVNARVLEPALLERSNPSSKPSVPCRRCSNKPM